MKKMTKLFALITAMAMAFSLVACSSSNSDSVTVESIEINDIELNTTDKDVAIEYTLMPEGAEGEVTMSIADDTIATIKDGKISAVSEGETEFLISVGEIAEVARVTVKDADKVDETEKPAVEDKKDSNSTATKNNASTKSDTSTKNNGTSNSTASSSKSDVKPATTPTPEPAKPAATPTPEQKPAETPQPTPEPTPAPQPQPETTPAPAPTPAPEQPSGGTPDAVIGSGPMDKNQIIEVPPQDHNEYDEGNAEWC